MSRAHALFLLTNSMFYPYLICASTFVLLSDIVLAEKTTPGRHRSFLVTVGLSSSCNSTIRGKIKCGWVPLRNINMHVHVKNNNLRGVPIAAYISCHNMHTTCVIARSLATSAAYADCFDSVEHTNVTTSHIRATCRCRLNRPFRLLTGWKSGTHLHRPTTRPVSAHTTSL